MTGTFERLTALLMQLPGIGRKTAHRIGFFLLKMRREEIETLTSAMLEAHARLHHCPICFNLTENEQCSVCTDPAREQRLICVVESPADVLALERSHAYHGLYHVLGGALSPLDDVGPEDLRIKELLDRLADQAGSGDWEVIIATNPTTEGEATATYLARALSSLPNVKVTRIARGLPIGSDLDLADEVTLARALEGRKELTGA